MVRFLILLCFTLLGLAPLIFAQDAEIRAMLQTSVDDWNRGDLVAFASCYEDSPETAFIGEEVVRGGVDAILGRYRRAYSTRESMGRLTFSEIDVRSLSPDVALVTGRFHLERSEAGGGEASGRYTLIVRKSDSGWKIIHDHTSSQN